MISKITGFHILVSGGALAAVAALFAGYRYKATKMRRRSQRQALAVGRAIEELRNVEVARPIGVGNIGAVYEARLRDGWHEELGIQWAAEEIPEGPLALKLAIFDHPAKRAEVLSELAAEIMANRRAPNPVPLCPFLAIGLMDAPAAVGGRFLVEVMPLIPGRPLREALDSGALDVVPAAELLAQLRRILATVEFLESRGYYSRNLDEDNVIVQPDSAWMRIDFDNAKRADRRPQKRAHRLCRFLLRVLDQMDRSAASQPAAPVDIAATRAKIVATLASLDKHDDLAAAPLKSIEEIISAVKSLAGR